MLVANGEVMAETGGAYQVANFNAACRQIDASYPSATPGSYTVQTGDNLASIARAVWGDASLWHLLAEANGLTAGAGGGSQAINGANSATNPTSPGDLRVGQVLTIPNKVTNLHHNINTFTPYDPSKIIGETTPQVSAPAPQADGGGCGGFGQIVVAVVAIVVTIITEGATAEFFTEYFAASEGGATLAAAATTATAAAAGNLAGQATANAISIQHGFDGKSFAFAVLTTGGGVDAVDLDTATGAEKIGAQIVNGAVNNALQQKLLGPGLAFCLQDCLVRSHSGWFRRPP